MNLFQVPYWPCASCQHECDDSFPNKRGNINFEQAKHDLDRESSNDEDNTLCVRFVATPVAVWMAEASHLMVRPCTLK